MGELIDVREYTTKKKDEILMFWKRYLADKIGNALGSKMGTTNWRKFVVAEAIEGTTDETYCCNVDQCIEIFFPQAEFEHTQHRENVEELKRKLRYLGAEDTSDEAHVNPLSSLTTDEEILNCWTGLVTDKILQVLQLTKHKSGYNSMLPQDFIDKFYWRAVREYCRSCY